MPRPFQLDLMGKPNKVAVAGTDRALENRQGHGWDCNSRRLRMRGWRMEGGGWRMEDGGWRRMVFLPSSIFYPPSSLLPPSPQSIIGPAFWLSRFSNLPLLGRRHLQVD